MEQYKKAHKKVGKMTMHDVIGRMRVSIVMAVSFWGLFIFLVLLFLYGNQGLV